MPRRLLLAVVPLFMLTASLSLAQTPTDRLAPTIPETQIEPAELSSDYEFISAATSANQFVIEAAALAGANAESAEVKALATKLSTAHTVMMSDISAAGKADEVDISQPSVDGDQKGLLGKLESLNGAEFDRAYVESQLFVHQRTIAYFRGYADETDNLGKFAKATLPALVAHYESLVALAGTVGLDESQPATPQ